MYPVDLLKVCSISSDDFTVWAWLIDLDANASFTSDLWRALYRYHECGVDYLSN